MCGMWVCAWAPHGSRGAVAVRGDDGGELEFPVENLRRASERELIHERLTSRVGNFRGRALTLSSRWPREVIEI